MPVRRALVQIHLWIGLVAGLYITAVSVTGAALVFRIDLQRAMHPRLFTAGAEGPLADPVDVLTAVQKAYPGDRVSGVDAPTTWRPTYLAYSSHDRGFRTLLLDPVGATLLGELDDRTFVRTLQNVHFDLLGGRRGRLVNGIGALCLLVMGITGAIIWWPGRGSWRRGLTIDVRRPWKRVIWEGHGAVGIWSVAFIAMWAVTGVAFALPGAFRSAVNAISPITVMRTPQSGPTVGGAPALPWRTLVDLARRHAPPDHHVARVVTPSNGRAPFLVMFSGVAPAPPGAGLVSVYLDQYTGAVLASSSSAATLGDSVMAWAPRLHVGNFAGNGVRMVWFVFGMMPPLLFASGFTMWWTRVMRPRAQRAASSASSVA